MIGEVVRSWPFAWGMAVVTHLALGRVPVVFEARDEPQEVVEFELAELPVQLPPEPEPPPPPPPPPEKPPGPKNPDPTADPELTSLESNREDIAPPSEPVPIVTGLALDADQLVEGGMGVRVGNTDASGYDADVAPGDIKGFTGGGAGGGDGNIVVLKPDVPAELLRAWQPEYPRKMKDLGVEGRVLLRVTVLTNGRAGAVAIVESVHPDLDRVAMAAMKRFRWRPARRDNKKVESTIQLAIRFQLRT